MDPGPGAGAGAGAVGRRGRCVGPPPLMAGAPPHAVPDGRWFGLGMSAGQALAGVGPRGGGVV